MKYKIQCPACEKDFSFVRILNKFFLTKPCCPHCRSTLKVLNVGIYNFFLMMLFGGVAVLYIQRQISLGLAVNFFIPVLLVLIYELIVMLLICNLGQITIKKNRYIKKQDVQD